MSERPIAGRPKYHVNVTLEGRCADKLKPYAVIASTDISNDVPAQFDISVPLAFAAYRVRTSCHRADCDENAEMKLAQTVVDMVPRDTWDACLAALEIDTDAGRETCNQILQRWFKG